MDLQKACEVLEVLSENETDKENGRLSFREFHALQMVLLELQADGKYILPEKYSTDM